MSKLHYYNLQLNDINNRLLSLEKKTSKILYILEYLTNKIDDIHNDTFLLSSGSTINNISPICSPRIKHKNKYISSPTNKKSNLLYVEDTTIYDKKDTALPAISTAIPCTSPPIYNTCRKKNIIRRKSSNT